MTSIAGKTVLITGAAKRIGREVALRLHAEGARVLVHFGSSEMEARQTAAECGGAPVFQANLESVDEIRSMFAAVASQYERLDCLVNNAARFETLDVMAIQEHNWDRIHSVNLKATFFCCQAAARIMRADGKGGCIVNFSSLGGVRPWAEHAHYCASKAGVIMLTKALAKALAPDITVNSVAPGVFPFEESEEQREDVVRMIRRSPVKRAGNPDDITDAVLYLLSTSNFVTGQTILVDGGLNLS